MTYSTRRLSSTQETAPIPINVRASAAVSGSASAASLSSSAGKHRRPSYSLASARRRSSQSHAAGSAGAGATVRVPPPGIHISHSLPAQASITAALASRGKTFISGSAIDDEDDGEVKTAGLSKKEKGQLYECEKCSKVYRHSTCLVKHRWEHTAHWKEASKLLLSKHQQVQLLEAAAILNAASAGSSLPDEKSLWPAAVSPPSSGLLGSDALNIDILTSPLLNAVRSLPSSSQDAPDIFDEDDDDIEIDNDLNDNTSSESVSTGDDLHMAESMLFDMDIDDNTSSSVSMAPATKSSSAAGVGSSSDSGYGSFNPGSGVPARPVLGFFEGSRLPGAIV